MDYVIQHHGIKGQKWGVRRFQNEDGTLTEAGKKRTLKDSETDSSESNLNSQNKSNHKTLKTLGLIGATVAVSGAGLAFSKSPKVRSKVGKILNKMSKKKVKDIDIVPKDSGIFNKKLGRMLTIEEAIEKGLM